MERPLERPSNGASVLRKAEGEGNLGRREVDAADVPLGYGTERSLAALSAAASYTSELYTPCTLSLLLPYSSFECEKAENP